MANRVEILVEVDPLGRGQKGLKDLKSGLEEVKTSASRSDKASRDALSGVAQGLGIPLSVGAASAAGAAGLALLTKSAIDASVAGENSTARLRASALEAKLAFGEADSQALKFSKSLGLSETAGENAYAKIVQLTKVAGQTGKLPEISKNLADLAAAYGLQAGDIENLAQQLLSGQDEALNRLGISDPSKLYKEYAATLGKSAEALTQQEQAQARLNAVVEKGALHAGAADRRAQTSAGVIGQLGAAYDDATRKGGQFLLNQTALGDAIRDLNALINGKPLMDDSERYAQQNRDALLQAKAATDRELKRLQIEQEINKDPAAAFKSFDHLVIARGEAEANRLRDQFKTSYEKLFKSGTIDPVTLDFAERQLKNVIGVFDRADAQEIATKLAAMFQKAQAEALNFLKGVRQEAEGTFSTFADRYSGGDNPFVKILGEARAESEKLQKSFAVLGDRGTAELRKVSQEYTRQRLLAAQLDAELNAASLRREAERIREAQSLRDLTKLEEGRLRVLDAQLKAAREIPELLANAEALRSGRTGPNGLGVDQARVQGEEFRRLQEQLDLASKLPGALGVESVARTNRELVSLFNSLDPELKRAIAQGRAPGRETFAGAFESEAASRERAAAAEQRRFEAGRRSEERDARFRQAELDRIREAERAGLNPQEVDRRLLALSQGDVGGLPKSLQDARFDALNRSAERSENLQRDARSAVDKATDSTDNLTRAIDNLARETRNPENRRILIEVLNRSRANVREELYGSVNPQPVNVGTNR